VLRFELISADTTTIPADASCVSRGHGASRVQSKCKPIGSTVSGKSANHPLEEDFSESAGDDRRNDDRRNRPTRPWIGMLGPLRRARGRRETDQFGYVDRYSRREVALILAVFVMNVGDAFMTMLWLERGGREANPVMDFLLDIGPGAFLAQKCILVGIWLVILLVHKNFRFARIGLYASLVTYAVLMIIHFGIIALGISPTELQDAAHSGPRIQHFRIPRGDESVSTTALANGNLRPIIDRRVDRPEVE
jgi:hypothetical protein